MSFLPADLPSFLWGIAIGGIAALLSGIFKKAGEDLYGLLKSRLAPPAPISVPHDFDPVLYEKGGCAWVPESDLERLEANGYTYYPHKKRSAKCFRMTYSVHGQINEYLMAKPNAKRRHT